MKQSLLTLGFWTKLMVVGGYNSAQRKSEIYDLSGQNLNCPPINDYPVNYGSVGTFIGNKTLVCGGYTTDYTSNCYYYDMQVIFL